MASQVERIAVVEFCERQHELIVQLLGPVAVQTRAGVSVDFDRSKAQELVVWLTQHRRRPTRMSARTALWDLAVRDATFSNVVSDARRAMAKLVMPPAGQEWIGRTMNEDLPLHDMVVSESSCSSIALPLPEDSTPHDAIAVLRPGVALINGMAFEGTSYLWPDAEGITSAHVLLATSAAAELAGHYLTVGDVDGVFWATGQGLKVLAGHEELIALRCEHTRIEATSRAFAANGTATSGRSMPTVGAMPALAEARQPAPRVALAVAGFVAVGIPRRAHFAPQEADRARIPAFPGVLFAPEVAGWARFRHSQACFAPKEADRPWRRSDRLPGGLLAKVAR